MKKLTFLLVLSVLFTASSCDKDDPILSEVTSIELNFKANFEGERLVMGQTYDYNGRSIRFSVFDFYVSDMVLVQNNGSSIEETEVVDVDLIDLSFDDSDPNAAESGRTLAVNNVEIGEYVGVKMGLGVPGDLNRTNFVDYPSSHPLNNAAHYWAGWGSFIFARVEGRFDADNDGTFEKGFVYHTGTDDSFKTKSVDQVLMLDKDSVQKLVFDINLKGLLKTIEPLCDDDSDGYIDLHLDNCDGTHTDDNLEISAAMMTNFRNAIVMVE